MPRASGHDVVTDLIEVVGSLIGRQLLANGSIPGRFDPGKPHLLFRDDASGERGMVKVDGESTYDSSSARFFDVIAESDVSIAVWVAKSWNEKDVSRLNRFNEWMPSVKWYGVAMPIDGSAPVLVVGPDARRSVVIEDGASVADQREFFKRVELLAKPMVRQPFTLRNNPLWLYASRRGSGRGLYIDAFQNRRPMRLGYYADGEQASGIYDALSRVSAEIEAGLGERPIPRNPGFKGKGINVVIEVPFNLHVSTERVRGAEWCAERLGRFATTFQNFLG